MHLVAILLIAGLFLGLLLFVGSLQRGMMFPYHLRVPDDRVAASLPDLERIGLATSQGQVEAWYRPARGVPEGVQSAAVIFAHGNAELIEDWPLMLDGFPELGLGLMLVEYPGYGRSEGRPSQPSIREAMLAGFDALAARPEIDPDRIVLYGRSIGGGAVATILGDRPVSALILQSTFTSAADLARELFRLPAWLVRDPFRTLDAVKDFPGPVLVLHGRHDEIIPFQHGVALSEASPGATLHPMNCGHNDCPPSWPEFWRVVGRFLVGAELIGRGPGGTPTVSR